MVQIIWYEEMGPVPSARSVWLSGKKGLIERIKKRWDENWSGKTNTGSFDTAICVSLNL